MSEDNSPGNEPGTLAAKPGLPLCESNELVVESVRGPPSSRFLEAELELNLHLRRLKFSEPVCYVYNPLEYAWDTHSCYVEKYCQAGQRVLFLGMNPGPFGMAQTGVSCRCVKTTHRCSFTPSVRAGRDGQNAYFNIILNFGRYLYLFEWLLQWKLHTNLKN